MTRTSNHLLAFLTLSLACAANLQAQITDLATFNGGNGTNPNGPLTLSGSTLYGATFSGGVNSYGTVFSLPVGGGSPTDLASFNSTNATPYGGLILSGSTLYGTSEYGGAGSDGEVFSVPVGGGTPTILASFNGSSNGQVPNGGLTLSGSTLYGTTYAGGTGGWGGVYSVPPA